MTTWDDIVMQMAELDVDYEENEELVLDEGVEEDVNRFKFYLLDRFLTVENINTRVIRSNWRTFENLQWGKH